MDSRPDSCGLYFLYLNGSRAGTIQRAELRYFKGAVDNAIFYTLLESSDIVGVDPLAWLNNLHDDTPPEQIKHLLPYYYKKISRMTS